MLMWCERRAIKEADTDDLEHFLGKHQAESKRYIRQGCFALANEENLAAKYIKKILKKRRKNNEHTSSKRSI